MSAGRAASGIAYRPDIQGLRAIAVSLVVAFHCGLPAVGGGFVGVDVFFVLSGYLITELLVVEQRRTRTISLVAFYARRIRRLLPASALML
ncbi:MAG: acyltransferase family protein, partial [Gammaproteobacteria bacterium]|nr:acyltransferase family protein [Gammaproteobacteria bacterium]